MNNSRLPSVTIAICTRNRAELLPNAIMSALNQVYDNFEVIVVDNASSDNTKDVVLSFSQINSRVKYVYEGKAGLHNAMRRAYLDESKADFVTILHDDDEFGYDEFISDAVKLFEKNKNKNQVCVFSNLNYHFVPLELDKIMYCFSQEFWDGKELFCNGPRIIADAGALIYRKALFGLELFGDAVSSLDTELMYKLMTQGSFGYIDKVGYKHYIHNDCFSLVARHNAYRNIQSFLWIDRVVEFCNAKLVFDDILLKQWANKIALWTLDASAILYEYEYNSFISMLTYELPSDCRVVIYGANLEYCPILIAGISKKRPDIKILSVFDDFRSGTIQGYKICNFFEVSDDVKIIISAQHPKTVSKILKKISEKMNLRNVFSVLDIEKERN